MGGDFTMFWGAASGSARKALRALEESNVMISYATKLNQPWRGIETLFIDCGGYSMLKSGKDHPPRCEYTQYLVDVNPELWALPDYPCEPDLLAERGETVRSHQLKTTDAHAEMIDQNAPGEPVAVLQGWRPQDYVDHLADLSDRGLLTDHVGIGSVCRRNAEAEIKEVVTTVRDAIGPDTHLHGFGVKTSVLRYPAVLTALDSADTTAWEYRQFRRDDRGRIPQYLQKSYHYLSMKREIADITTDDPSQTTLSEVEP